MNIHEGWGYRCDRSPILMIRLLHIYHLHEILSKQQHPLKDSLRPHTESSNPIIRTSIRFVKYRDKVEL